MSPEVNSAFAGVLTAIAAGVPVLVGGIAATGIPAMVEMWKQKKQEGRELRRESRESQNWIIKEGGALHQAARLLSIDLKHVKANADEFGLVPPLESWAAYKASLASYLPDDSFERVEKAIAVAKRTRSTGDEIREAMDAALEALSPLKSSQEAIATILRTRRLSESTMTRLEEPQ